jgi:hypothetical protein
LTLLFERIGVVPVEDFKPAQMPRGQQRGRRSVGKETEGELVLAQLKHN